MVMELTNFPEGLHPQSGCFNPLVPRNALSFPSVEEALTLHDGQGPFGQRSSRILTVIECGPDRLARFGVKWVGPCRLQVHLSWHGEPWTLKPAVLGDVMWSFHPLEREFEAKIAMRRSRLRDTARHKATA